MKEKIFVLTANGSKFKVSLPEYYDQINTQLGLADVTPADENLFQINETTELLTNGLAIKVRTRRKANNKYFTTDLYIPISKLNTAMKDLVGKNFGTRDSTKGEITKVYFPKRRRLG